MKKGARVKIFHDPFTRACVEGEAKLVKFFKDMNSYNGEKYEMWEVIFDGDVHILFRRFSEADIL
jgi:hypothetical protein